MAIVSNADREAPGVAPDLLTRLWSLLRGVRQRATAGAYATSVQIAGHHNTVLLAGEARLQAERRHARRAEPRNQRELMLTELRATELVGRQEELGTLRAWMTAPRPGRDISVHCVTGQGGAGKTRLAIELCEWAEQVGWSAGFVSPTNCCGFANCITRRRGAGRTGP